MDGWIMIHVLITINRSSTNAAFHWAWIKLVFTSFQVPLKSKVVFRSGKLGILRAPRLPTRKYELGTTSF